MLSTKRKIIDTLTRCLIYVCAGFSVCLLAGIILYVLAKGIRTVNWSFLTSVTSVLNGTVGIAGNIVNTLIIVLITMLIATPIGVGSAIYLNESVFEKEVLLSGGHMTVEQLSAMLNTMPFEITFVDANNINRFFNEGPKDFKRPQMAIDRDVFSCHPPKIGQKVRHIIESFREGTLDEVPVWMEKNGKNLLVRYIAVRDSEKHYVGTLELVQDVTFIREYYARIK